MKEEEQQQQNERPLFAVGMIADIQYAPVPDGFSFSGNPRYYRHALVATKRAFQTFRNYNTSNDTDGDTDDIVGGVDLVVNLGDIIDGKCQEIERNGGEPPPLALALALATQKGETNNRHHPGMMSLLEVESAMEPFSSLNDNDTNASTNANANNHFDNNNNHDNNVDNNNGKNKNAGTTTTTTNNNNNNNNTNNDPPRTTKQQPKQKQRPILHSYGNHCLYNLNRTELREKLGIPFRIEHKDSPPPTGRGTICDLINNNNNNMHNMHTSSNDSENDNNANDAAATDTTSTARSAAAIGDNDGDLVGYYSHVHPPQQQQHPQCPTNDGNGNTSSIKFVVLDGYDVCLMRRCPQQSSKRKAAVEILQRENGTNYRKGNGNENSPEGLEGLQKRFVAFNGAVGPAQLQWLRHELEATRQLNNNNSSSSSGNRHDQKVIVLSHQPIHPESSNPVCLIWNYDRVLGVLREYSDVVVASFAGHAHRGGYARDGCSGIHFRVVEAVLESEPPTATFGVLEVYRDRLVLRGHGDCESAVYEYEHDRTNT